MLAVAFHKLLSLYAADNQTLQWQGQLNEQSLKVMTQKKFCRFGFHAKFSFKKSVVGDFLGRDSRRSLLKFLLLRNSSMEKTDLRKHLFHSSFK